ncbi:CMD domain protein [Tessaracoccus sp. G1721]
MTGPVDVVDALAGIDPGSRVDGVRRSREVTRAHIQLAEEALFERGGNRIWLRDRWLVAAFATGLIAPCSPSAEYRASRLADDDQALVARLLGAAVQRGPWGSYREPGLVHENVTGDVWQVPDADRPALGAPLAAVLEYAHLLLLHPRDARPETIDRLVDAGWGRAQIVTWSQLVSFLAFQARLVAGLDVLAGEEAS